MDHTSGKWIVHHGNASYVMEMDRTLREMDRTLCFVREFEQDSVETYFTADGYSTNLVPETRVPTAKTPTKHNLQDMIKVLREFLCNVETVQCLILGLTDLMLTLYVQTKWV